MTTGSGYPTTLHERKDYIQDDDVVSLRSANLHRCHPGRRERRQQCRVIEARKIRRQDAGGGVRGVPSLRPEGEWVMPKACFF